MLGRLPSQAGRYVLCSRCDLPNPEARLLMAIFNVTTVPALDAKMGRAGELALEAER